MEKDIIFIDSRNSFVVKGIKSSFEKEDFKCEIIPLDENINDYLNVHFARNIFICVYEDAQNYIELYKKINEEIAQTPAKIFFMGFEEDLEKTESIFAEDKIAYSFKRPANAAQVAEELKDLITSGKSVKTKKHILLVDDSGTLLNAIKGWLDDDYRVSMANSAVNALFFLANNRPDLILLDYAMPVCDGPTLFNMLRSEEKTKTIPIIFLTGVEDQESMTDLLMLSPDGYLVKSMSREGILSQIEAFFERDI